MFRWKVREDSLAVLRVWQKIKTEKEERWRKDRAALSAFKVSHVCSLIKEQLEKHQRCPACVDQHQTALVEGFCFKISGR